jgi:hypothetical protein
MKMFGNICYALGIVVAITVVLSMGATHQHETEKGASTCWASLPNQQCNQLATPCAGTYVWRVSSTSGMFSAGQSGNQCGGHACAVEHLSFWTGCE